MERSTNALADLVETLKTGLSEKFGIPDDCDPFQSAVIKSVRIVEELAKVEDVTESHGFKPVQIPNMWQCFESVMKAVMKCRAIAEEGETK